VSAPHDDLADVPVVILAGGLGTRLREETERVPKPLVMIGEKPILWHIMKLYRHHGVRRFILCLGYKSEHIKNFFLRYRELNGDWTIRLGRGEELEFHREAVEDWEVTCVETGLHTATGARLARVEHFVEAERFFFTYGDGLGDVDLHALAERHREGGRIGTVTGVHPTSRYGEMRVDGDAVAEFNEKPTRPEGFVSGGFFMFERKVFDYLDDDPGLFLEYAPLQRLARDGQLSLHSHTGFWMGMDTYRDFTALNDLWATGDAPWKLWDD
jgi:glucose-1-phosphate cytidylyltransferase